jgi:hypothetical protein
MEISTVINLINNTCFPIACVCILGYYVNQLTDSHKKEVDALTKEINKMSIALTKLTDKIDELKKE